MCNWINSEIRSHMKVRDKSRKINLNSVKLRKPEEYINSLNSNYKHLRNKTRYSIRKAKANFINNINKCGIF
jgi:hypothetical protein